MATTKVDPISDMVVVRKYEVKQSPLYLPGGDDVDSPLWSRLSQVVKVGPGRMTDHGVRIPPHVQEGDIVAFRRNIKDHGSWKEGDDQYVIVEDSKIALKVHLDEVEKAN